MSQNYKIMRVIAKYEMVGYGTLNQWLNFVKS